MRKLIKRLLALALSLLLGVSSGMVVNTPPAQAAGELAFPTAEGFGRGARNATRLLIAMAGKQSPFGGKQVIHIVKWDPVDATLGAALVDFA